MDYNKIQKLNEKLFFTVEDVAKLFFLKPNSARVLCSRYRQRGIFIRVKNNFYVTESSWSIYGREEFYQISNFLQVPSYLSFMTALFFYGVTTQVPKSYYENASIRRSKEINVDGVSFNFRKIKSEYFFGFEKKNNFFIATPEKALIDSLYLYSLGRYSLDLAALDIGKLDQERLNGLIEVYPSKTKKAVKRICGI
ncbi:MAG: hypothetical protein U9N73_04090 [Candidatus Auribacterota bacterium]|nr:hypothetical protein [Candidatus Auribacterota bacterium]